MSKNEEQRDTCMKEIMFEINKKNFDAPIKKVNILFGSDVEVEPAEGDDKSRTIPNDYGCYSGHMPHQDLVNAMNKLIESALKAAEFEVTATNKKDFILIGLKLDGNFDLNQASVTFFLAKKVYRAKEIYKLPATPAIVLNDSSNFLTWKEVSKLVAVVISESKEFVGGKHFDDNVPLAIQLSLPLPPAKEEKKEKKRKTATVPSDAVIDTMMASGAQA
jgi:hypothetical protein